MFDDVFGEDLARIQRGFSARIQRGFGEDLGNSLFEYVCGTIDVSPISMLDSLDSFDTFYLIKINYSAINLRVIFFK